MTLAAYLPQHHPAAALVPGPHKTFLPAVASGGSSRFTPLADAVMWRC
jgi:hypothetical protein